MISLKNENLIRLIIYSFRVNELNQKFKQTNNNLISKSILTIVDYNMLFKQIGYSAYTLN
jgi:hypothetical protein